MRLFAAVLPLFLATIICLWEIVAADLEDDYKREGVVPEVLDKAPKELLKVTYGQKTFKFGEELTPTEVKDVPSITWNFDPSKYYTLILNDPDAPSRQDPQMREFLHWVVVNVPGNDFSHGETLAQYMGAGPPKDTGLHRYILTVYSQPGKLSFEEKPMSNLKLDGRVNFSLRKFADKYSLGDPVAGNMFQAQYDDYVPLFYKRMEM